MATEPIDPAEARAEYERAQRAAVDAERRATEDAGHAARAAVVPLRSVTTWEEVPLGPILAGDVRAPEPSMFRRTDGAALLYAGRTHAFLGEFESGKTWAALAATVETIRTGAHVLYVDFEDDENTFVLRLRQLGVADPDISHRAHYVRPDRPLTSDGAAAALASVGDRHRPALVVLDGVTEAYALHDLNPNRMDDVARFLDLMPRRWDRTGAAVVMVDHVVKSKDERGKYAIGSQHKMAGVNGAAYRFDAVDLAPGRAGDVKVTIAKDRPGQVRKRSGKNKQAGTMHFRPAPDRGGPDGLDITVAPPTYSEDHGVDADLVEAVVAYVADNPGTSTRAVRGGVVGNAEHLADAIQRAAGTGRIRNAGTASRHAWEAV
jgi:hypothetical protein